MTGVCGAKVAVLLMEDILIRGLFCQQENMVAGGVILSLPA